MSYEIKQGLRGWWMVFYWGHCIKGGFKTKEDAQIWLDERELRGG